MIHIFKLIHTYIWLGYTIVHWYVDTVSYSETPIHQYISTDTIFRFFFVSLRFFRFRLPISSSFSLQNFSWLSNFSSFSFRLIFSLHFAYFSLVFASELYCFASMWNKWNHAFFSHPSETKFLFWFQFSLPKRKRGCTLATPYKSWKKILLNWAYRVSKEAEFYADFKNVQKSCVWQKGEKILQKNLIFRDLENLAENRFYCMRKNLWDLLDARVLHIFEISAKFRFFLYPLHPILKKFFFNSYKGRCCFFGS